MTRLAVFTNEAFEIKTKQFVVPLVVVKYVDVEGDNQITSKDIIV